MTGTGQSCEQVEIDTKGICVLCLGSTIDTNCFDSQSTLPSLQGLKPLLRYLNVSPKELFNCSTEFLQSMEIREDIDLKISLCSGCSSVIHKFNKLYQQYELIQLQFGNCVQSLYQSISEGNDSPERVRKYKDQMRPINSSDLVNASIAANLRNGTLKKCLLKLQSVTPRVKIAVQDLNFEKITKMQKVGEVANLSASTRGKTKVPEHEATLDQSFQILMEPNFDEKKTRYEILVNNVDVDNTTSTDDHQTFLQMSTEETSDAEVIAEVKSTNSNKARKESYLNSIRNKLKPKSPPTATATVGSSKFIQRSVRSRFPTTRICVHCNLGYTPASLKSHISTVHSEHVLKKFLPSNISLELCKQSLQQVLQQMYKMSENTCTFCNLNLSSKNELKRHMVCSHPQQISMKICENINLLSEERLNYMREDIPISDDAGSSTDFGSACEYCTVSLESRKSMKYHMCYYHPEQVIYKLFPAHIPLESCKQGLDLFFAETFKTSKSGFKCKFCEQTMLREASFKIHAVYTHGERTALEALRCIGLLPQHLEGGSSDALVNNKNYECPSNISTSEDQGEFDQSSTIQEMDFEIEEEESVIKLEHSPTKNLDLDPLLDMD